MGFKELCNLVCEKLPEGWTIIITLEKDAGGVGLEDDDDCRKIEFPTNRDNIEEEVLDALNFAQEAMEDEPQ